MFSNYTEKNLHILQKKRPFHFLTKRINGYTDMTFDTKKYRITSDVLLYIPSNTEYMRKSYDDENIAIHFSPFTFVNPPLFTYILYLWICMTYLRMASVHRKIYERNEGER